MSTSAGKSTPGYEKQISGKIYLQLKGHVVKVKAETYWYNDPYTLDFMRKDLKKKLMDAK